MHNLTIRVFSNRGISANFSRMEYGKLYRKLFAITLPIMIQNLISSSLSFVDTLMIGQLGQDQIAAVGIANQVFFFISLFFFGIASGTSIWISQFYGSGEYEKMERTMSFASMICLIGATLMSVFSFLRPDLIMKIFTEDINVIEPGVEYLRIVAVSYIFSSIAQTLSIGFRGIGKAHIPMIATFISLTLNAIGNYLLIFGIGPFPVMGVAGAALATTIARMLEFLIVAYFTWHGKTPFAFHHTSFHWSRDFRKQFTVTCLPVVLNEVLWASGMILYKVAYSKLGTEALATINISEAIANFFFIAMMGIGNGATILLGNILGSGDRETAIALSRRILVITLTIGFLTGILEALTAPIFASWFNVSATVIAAAATCLRINALQQPIKSFNMANIVGILRSGGDTRAAMLIEVFGLYAVGIPLSFVAVIFFHAPLSAVYAITALEEGTKLVLGYLRYRKGHWAKVLTSKAA